MLKALFKITILFIFCGDLGFSQTITANDIIGVWLTPDKKVRISIMEKEGKYFAQPIHIEKTDQEDKDNRIHGYEKPQKPPINKPIFTDFRFIGNGEWTGGKVFNPVNGYSHKGTITMKERGKLEITIYNSINSSGRTEIWTKID
ncbi:MAG: DUF2147 domain-containing protein [Ignavibacteriaceae bacterium]